MRKILLSIVFFCSTSGLVAAPVKPPQHPIKKFFVKVFGGTSNKSKPKPKPKPKKKPIGDVDAESIGSIGNTSGGGGGASSYNQLTDFKTTNTTTVATTPGGTVLVQGVPVKFASSCIATVTSGTGRFYIYIDSAGVFTVGHNITLSTTNCTATSGVTAFPDPSYPIYYCDVSGGTISTCTDQRSSAGISYYTAGAGCTIAGRQVTCGNAILTAGSGIWTMPGIDPGTQSNSTGQVPVANETWAYEFIITSAISVNKFSFNVSGASGTCGGTCGARFVIWASDKATVVFDSGAMTSGGTPNINTTGLLVGTNTGGVVTLQPGVYWAAFTTTSVVLDFWTPSHGGFNYGVFAWRVNNSPATIVRNGKCANNSTGSGASIAMPSSCGALTASLDFVKVPYATFWQE